jgi:ADP-ribosylglycohydrolase
MSVYRDKVLACWLGKNIGGTLGAPREGQKHVHDLDFYDPVPREPTGNDDLDFQLVWLKMLEERGVHPRLSDFADYWVRYLSAYPWNEYGFCRRNLERGLLPPISGGFENYFVDEMGSSVRSEIWACIAPGDPQLAAAMSWKDAVLDHAGGEGVYGEMFWAAVQSAAFVVRDTRTLIRIGLRMIPESCGIARIVREALWCWENGVRWAEARERIATRFGHYQPCHTAPNTGFIALGWLYGSDYGDCLCKAVNCGYDTDSTGATLGALLGIRDGTRGVPAKWRKPVGDSIVLHKFTGKFDAPETLKELTDRTAALAEQCLATRSETASFRRTGKPPEAELSVLFRNELALAALRQDIHAGVAADRDLEIAFHYGGEPVLSPGLARTFSVSFTQPAASDVASGFIPDVRSSDAASGFVHDVQSVTVKVPTGWKVSPVKAAAHRWHFTILASRIPPRNSISVAAKVKGQRYRASFTLLGPEEAIGYPAGANVPTCPRCGAWERACICPVR